MRLTDKERAAIVHEFAAGKGVREIARKFQVTHTTVSKILQKYQNSKSLESLTKFDGSSENAKRNKNGDNRQRVSSVSGKKLRKTFRWNVLNDYSIKKVP